MKIDVIRPPVQEVVLHCTEEEAQFIQALLWGIPWEAAADQTLANTPEARAASARIVANRISVEVSRCLEANNIATWVERGRVR